MAAVATSTVTSMSPGRGHVDGEAAPRVTRALSPPPTASVVVATRLRPVLLRRCLSALSELAVAPHEIIVVDNSDGDEATKITAEAAGARHIVESVGGQCRARNAGAQAATGDVVAFLDDDVVVDRDWLRCLLTPFEDAGVSVVTGRIMSLRHASEGTATFTGGGLMDLGEDPRAFERGAPDWFERANFGGIGNGPNMAFRRRLFETWPGFRESIGHGTPVPGGDEHYAFFELLSSGHRIVYTPLAIVGHPDPDSSAATRSFRARVTRQGSAHAVLLLIEAPGYRWRTLRFVCSGMFRRIGPADPGPERLPVGQDISLPGLLRAAIEGPALYLSSRRQHRRR